MLKVHGFNYILQLDKISYYCNALFITKNYFVFVLMLKLIASLEVINLRKSLTYIIGIHHKEIVTTLKHSQDTGSKPTLHHLVAC